MNDTHGATLRNDRTGETREVAFCATSPKMSLAEGQAWAQHGREGERVVAVWCKVPRLVQKYHLR